MRKLIMVDNDLVHKAQELSEELGRLSQKVIDVRSELINLARQAIALQDREAACELIKAEHCLINFTGFRRQR